MLGGVEADGFNSMPLGVAVRWSVQCSDDPDKSVFVGKPALQWATPLGFTWFIEFAVVQQFYGSMD